MLKHGCVSFHKDKVTDEFVEEALTSLGAGVGSVVLFLPLIRSHPMPVQSNLDGTCTSY